MALKHQYGNNNESSVLSQFLTNKKYLGKVEHPVQNKLPVSKPLQIIWMVVPGGPMGESSSNPQGAGTGNVSSTSIPQGLGMGQAHSQQQQSSAVQCPVASSQPPLIANPPSEPLIIPSHVANALLLTR